MPTPTGSTGSKFPLKFTRVSSGEDGETRFEDLDAPDTRGIEGISGYLTESMKVKEAFFYQFPAEYFDDWHNDNNLVVVFLEGKQTIEVGSGEKRTFGVGDVLYVNDPEGKGHRTYGVEAGKSLVMVC